MTDVTEMAVKHVRFDWKLTRMHSGNSQVIAVNSGAYGELTTVSAGRVKPCNLSQAPLSASLLQSLGTCVGLLGWADGLIVTTWRQWEGLMRNICFCVSTEPLIVRGKGYSAPIQTRHNENPSPPWAGWAYNIHPLLFTLFFFSFFLPTPLSWL